jgi:hypothetical protein
VVIAGIAVAALITGSATAAGVSRAPHLAATTTGTIYACYSNTTKTLFQTTQTKGCKRGFTELSWNAKGPAGPKGATGATGAPGIPGAGATVTSLASGNPNCSTGGASVTGGNGSTAFACNGAIGPAGPAGSGGVLIDAGGLSAYYSGGTYNCTVGDLVGADAGTIQAVGTLLGGTSGSEFWCAIAGFSSHPVPVNIFFYYIGAGPQQPIPVVVEASGQPGCPSSTLTAHGCIVFEFSDAYLQTGAMVSFYWEAMETAP